MLSSTRSFSSLADVHICSSIHSPVGLSVIVFLLKTRLSKRVTDDQTAWLNIIIISFAVQP